MYAVTCIFSDYYADVMVDITEILHNSVYLYVCFLYVSIYADIYKMLHDIDALLLMAFEEALRQRSY